MFYKEILAVDLIDKKSSFLRIIKNIFKDEECVDPVENPIFSEVSLVRKVLQFSGVKSRQ